jgi:hypothetical protein
MTSLLHQIIALGVLVTLGLLFSPAAHALQNPFESPQPYDGTWYNVTVASKHVNTDVEHNERNWGIGIERRFMGRNWEIGAYKNSYYRNTSYVMTDLTQIAVSDRLRLRFNAGLVTGYRYPITPMIIPVWTLDMGHWGVDFLSIPPTPGHMGVFGLQMKVKF